jgi:hypothetical protein
LHTRGAGDFRMSAKRSVTLGFTVHDDRAKGFTTTRKLATQEDTPEISATSAAAAQVTGQLKRGAL